MDHLCTASDPRTPAEARLSALTSLEAQARSGELRDLPWDEPEPTAALGRLALLLAMGLPSREVVLASSVLVAALGFPEFDCALACGEGGGFSDATSRLVVEALARSARGLLADDATAEVSALRDLLHALYAQCPPLRAGLRTLVGAALSGFARSPAKALTTAVAPLLSLVGQVLAGAREADAAHLQLLGSVIVPLHACSQGYDEFTPFLYFFHEELSFVVLQFQRLQPSLTPRLVADVLGCWPSNDRASTSANVLLLHEVERLLEGADDATFAEVQRPLLRVLCPAISSDNTRTAQRALEMWKNAHFRALVARCAAQTYRGLLAALVNGGQRHWSPPVNNLRRVVLEALVEDDRAAVPDAARVLEFAASLCSDEEVYGAAEQEGASIPPPVETDVEFLKLVFGHELGTGSFATVRYAKLIEVGKPQAQWREFAVKEMEMKMLREQEAMENVAREIAVMQRLRHPNVAALVAHFEYRDRIYLVLEYAKRGDLHTQLTKVGSLSLESGTFVLAELVLALEHCHENGIVYGDLKPENVLLTDNRHVKLGDFGTARPVEESVAAGGDETVPMADRLEGTAEYLAPELVRGAAPTPASDLWALGCVVYQVFAGRPPLWAEAEAQLMQKIVSFDVEDYPAGFPADARALVEMLLVPDPAARASFEQIRAHPLFAGLDWAQLHHRNPPEWGQGSVAPAAVSKFAARKYSIMRSAAPQRYEFNDESFKVAAVEEGEEERGASWLMSPRLPGGGPGRVQPVVVGGRRAGPSEAKRQCTA